MFPSLTGYGWNGTRYYDTETGRFVSSIKVRDALENVMDQAALNMNALSQQLIDGSISLADWQTGMMYEIKVSHAVANAAANGGWSQVTQSAWGYEGQLVKEQYQYLRNFANEIASGAQPLDGRLLVRSDLYGDAARDTYEKMRGRLMQIDGYEEEIRDLEDGAEHCDGCLEQAGHWEPIGMLDDIGDEECQVRCKCIKRYRKIAETGEWEESE
jgi:hypothetical protein